MYLTDVSFSAGILLDLLTNCLEKKTISVSVVNKHVRVVGAIVGE